MAQNLCVAGELCNLLLSFAQLQCFFVRMVLYFTICLLLFCFQSKPYLFSSEHNFTTGCDHMAVQAICKYVSGMDIRSDFVSHFLLTFSIKSKFDLKFSLIFWIGIIYEKV
jgi:hypothetical protein